jgi:hypothetical protein
VTECPIKDVCFEKNIISFRSVDYINGTVCRNDVQTVQINTLIVLVYSIIIYYNLLVHVSALYGPLSGRNIVTGEARDTFMPPYKRQLVHI